MTKANEPARRTTIKDIARKAGVDPSTVTRALQGSSRVKVATREKIVRIASELGYVPSMAAQTLVNRRSGLVGVVIPDMTNPFFADLGKGIEDEASKHDLRILIIDTRGLEAAEREAINLFMGLKVDGLIVPSPRCPKEYYEALQDRIPLVHVNRDDTRNHVSVDTVLGSTMIMQHLLDLGHRRIAFVRGPAGPGREPKMLAYRRALDGAGLAYTPELIFTFDGSFDSSERIAAELAGLDEPPSAVFAWNDVNAIALVHSLRRLGVRVPQDMSVAGHDDIQLAEYVDPPLTTVAWPMYELGQQSVRYLYSLFQGTSPRPPQIPPPELILRGSTSSPPRLPAA